jgi:peptide/nickel transport system substrate-binding protein/oligopeptide transport system substrate-binding protein
MKKVVLLLIVLLLATFAFSAAEQVLRIPGYESGPYLDFMKTLYAKAGIPEIIQIPLTAYDNNYDVHMIAAESMEASEDLLTWTITIREGLKWSNGEPLTAHDYAYALQSAVMNGYDFGWFWSWAAGIKNWGEVEKGEMDISEFGVRAVDDRTLIVETATPKPFLPGIASYWFPVSQKAVETFGDKYATRPEYLYYSGPFTISEWVMGDRIVYTRNDHYNAPWKPELEKIIEYTSLNAPEVGFPAYLADELDWTELNAGQLAFTRKRFADQLKSNPLMGIFYMSFNYEQEPFNNPDVRRAFMYAIDINLLSKTILKDIALPMDSLVPAGFPGYNEIIADMAKYDPAKAKEYLEKAGYKDGKDFPKVELWYRQDQGFYAIIQKPLAEYIQSQIKKNLGVEIDVQVKEFKTWIDALYGGTHDFFICPYLYDYIDPSNFFDIFLSGGRHNWSNAEYDALVKEADALLDWDERMALYTKAEQILIDEAVVPYLVHPLQNYILKATVKGAPAEPNDAGFTNIRTIYYGYTHINIEE